MNLNMNHNMNPNQPITGNMNHLHQTHQANLSHASYIALHNNAPPNHYNLPHLSMHQQTQEANKAPYILANTNQAPLNTNNIAYAPSINIQSIPSMASISSLPSIPSLPSLSTTLNGLPAIPSYPPPETTTLPVSALPSTNYYGANHYNGHVSNNNNIVPNIPNIASMGSMTTLPHIPSLPSIPSMPSLGTMRSIPSIPSFPSLHSIADQSQDHDGMHRSPTVRSNLSSLGSDHDNSGSDQCNMMTIISDHNQANHAEFPPSNVPSPLVITPLQGSPKPPEDASNATTPTNASAGVSVLDIIDATTMRTMQITDNLATNQNINDLNAQMNAIRAQMNRSINTMNNINAMNTINTQMMTQTAQRVNHINVNQTDTELKKTHETHHDDNEKEEEEQQQSQHNTMNTKEAQSAPIHDTNKNPWFNDEIASIVKLHRKTIRKYHRSKTKKKELKLQCKELEKKKRKLIKAAKQKYTQQLMAQSKKEEEENNALPQTHIANMRDLDQPLIEIPQFFKTATKQIYQICDTYL